jgi:hypothetical protein
MECDDSVSVSSPESSSPLLSKAASDPVHGNVVDNRHPSNASSINALQPRTRSTSCAYVVEYILALFVLTFPHPPDALKFPSSSSLSTPMRKASAPCGPTVKAVAPWTWSLAAMASPSSIKPDIALYSSIYSSTIADTTIFPPPMPTTSSLKSNRQPANRQAFYSYPDHTQPRTIPGRFFTNRSTLQLSSRSVFTKL